MPRGFTSDEKDHIRCKLLEAGRSYLETIGLRKTTVEDLTRAAGISKGAFYLFYPSKEELFLEVFEAAERDIQSALLDLEYDPARGARNFFSSMLRESFAVWERNALLRNFDRLDYEALLRRIPPERVQVHLRGDDAFIERLFEKWEAEGIRFTIPPKKVSGLLKALFFIGLHKSDLGPQVYDDAMDVLIDLAADHLVAE